MFSGKECGNGRWPTQQWYNNVAVRYMTGNFRFVCRINYFAGRENYLLYIINKIRKCELEKGTVMVFFFNYKLILVVFAVYCIFVP